VQQGLALYDPRQHRSHASLYGGHDPGVCCRCYSALTLWELGYPDQALRAIQEALSLARELSHPLTSVIAMYFAAWVHYHRGENHAAAEMAEAAVALATPHGFSPWLEDAARLRSCLTIEPGRGQTAIARLPSAAAVGPAGRESWREVFSLCLLARAYGALDQSEKALAVLSEAVAMAEKHIEGFYEPELYRLKGELLLTQTGEASQDAETRFRGAIELARTRQKKSMELRAATSLGRLLARQGRRDEARRALAGIYGSFSEGFGTRDLKEAGALLDELKMAADGDR
jgi:predicted ATPase